MNQRFTQDGIDYVIKEKDTGGILVYTAGTTEPIAFANIDHDFDVVVYDYLFDDGTLTGSSSYDLYYKSQDDDEPYMVIASWLVATHPING